jgi:hypothetical protein
METLETTQDLPTELQENKFPTITGELEFDDNETKLARLRSAYDLIVRNRSLWIMTVTEEYHVDIGQRLMILEWYPAPLETKDCGVVPCLWRVISDGRAHDLRAEIWFVGPYNV